MIFKEKYTKLKVRMKKIRHYLSKKSSFWKEQFKTIKRKKTNILKSWSVKRRIINNGQETCRPNTSNRSKIWMLSLRKQQKSFLKFKHHLKILNKNTPMRKLDGKNLKQTWKITWPLVKANITRCKEPLTILKTRVEMRLRNCNSIFRMPRNFISKERKNLRPHWRSVMRKLRIWRTCSKRKWLFSSKRLNSRMFKTNNLSLNLMNLERATTRWLRQLNPKQENLMMAKKLPSNK